MQVHSPPEQIRCRAGLITPQPTLHKCSVMRERLARVSRKSCYFFVRPKRSFLEVCVFLRRALKAPQVRRADRVSTSKVAHILQIRHRDEVEAPVSDWLQEAYERSDAPSPRHESKRATSMAKRRPRKKKAKVGS